MFFRRLAYTHIALLLSVFLLAFPRGGYAYISEFKYTLFLLICGGFCAIAVIARTQLAIIGNAPLGNFREYIGKLSTTEKFLLLFLCFVVVSSLLSDFPGTFRGAFRNDGVLSYIIFVTTSLLLAKYFSPQKWMLYLIGASTMLFCALALVQLAGANPFTLYPKGQNYFGANIYYSGEFLGTIGNAGHGAAFLSLAAGVLAMAFIKIGHRFFLASFSIAVVLILKMGVDAAVLALMVGFVVIFPVAIVGRTTLARTLITLATVIAMFTLSQTFVFTDAGIVFAPVRLSLLALCVVILALAWVAWKFEMPLAWYKFGAVVVAVSLICTALFYVFFFGWRHTGMIFEASEVLRGRWDDSFGTSRIFIWRNVLERITLGNLLFGTGPDTLGFWNIEPFTRYCDRLGTVLTARIDAAHNVYLHILATMGLPAVLSYLAAIAVAMRKWFLSPCNQVSAIAGAGVLFYCIQAFFGISSPVTDPFFWACFGVLVSTFKVEGE